MTYLVTGGAGFIGSHLVNTLLAQQQRVIVIDDFSLGKEEYLPKNNELLTVVKRSVCDDISDVFTKQDIDVVFHLAAIPNVQFSIDYPTKTHQVNVNGVLNILEACKQSKVRRLVFVSSASVYGNANTTPFKEDMPPYPMSPYALHKLIGEQYAKLFNELYNVQTVSLRYFNVFGPRQNPERNYGFFIPKFITLISKNIQPTIYGDGKQTRDFIYISDVVAATIKAADLTNTQCLGQTINIASGQALSVNEVTDKILALRNSSFTPLFGPSVVEQRDSVADISKAAQLLGWQPEQSFDEGLKQTYDYFVSLP